MNAVTKQQEPPNSVADYSGGLLEVIARAARDPSVDIDKMERLISMQERVQNRNAEVAFNAALAELQPLLPVIEERGGIKDRSGNVQSTYALWEDVNEAIRPHLAEHGFALRFRVDRTADQISVTGILSHREGHKEETTLTLPTDTSGSKNAVQAVGSSTSYGKRYTAFALLNITSTGEDDDGNKAGMAPKADAVNDDTLTSIIEYCEAVGGNQSSLILGAYKVKRLDELTQKQGEAALKRLKEKMAEKADG